MPGCVGIWDLYYSNESKYLYRVKETPDRNIIHSLNLKTGLFTTNETSKNGFLKETTRRCFIPISYINEIILFERSDK